MISPDYIS